MSSDKNPDPMKIYFVRNRAAERLGDDAYPEVLNMFTRQLENGYRVAFPVVRKFGKVTQTVALLARSDDSRLKCVKELSPSSDSTHVFCLWAFGNHGEWLRFATQIIAVFPDQPHYGVRTMPFFG